MNEVQGLCFKIAPSESFPMTIGPDRSSALRDSSEQRLRLLLLANQCQPEAGLRSFFGFDRSVGQGERALQ